MAHGRRLSSRRLRHSRLCGGCCLFQTQQTKAFSFSLEERRELRGLTAYRYVFRVVRFRFWRLAVAWGCAQPHRQPQTGPMGGCLGLWVAGGGCELGRGPGRRAPPPGPRPRGPVHSSARGTELERVGRVRRHDRRGGHSRAARCGCLANCPKRAAVKPSQRSAVHPPLVSESECMCNGVPPLPCPCAGVRVRPASRSGTI